MLKEWKSKRQLSLFVALALSAGGGALLSDFQYAYAADVTGGDVVIDAGHPGVPIGNAHDIPGATDNRNVVGNKLTVDGVGAGTIYGGYTAGNGATTYNEVILSNGGTANNIYGGWSNQGNATNNTVTLSRASTFANVYGGYSNNASAEVVTGNTLHVTTNQNSGSLSNVVEKYYRKISGCLCSSTLPCFVIEHIEDATTEVFKVPKSVAHTL